MLMKVNFEKFLFFSFFVLNQNTQTDVLQDVVSTIRNEINICFPSYHYLFEIDFGYSGRLFK